MNSTQKNQGNSALVLIENAEVTQQYFASAQANVTEDTLFPTASFSKWVAALGVLSLVEAQLLDLNAPVSDYLTRWRLPDSEFDNDAVTIRALLSHTAGLTDRLGFGDYELDETIPNLAEELANPRASNDRAVEIAVGIEPGTEFLYSGGGYLILQLVVEEVSGVAFQDYIRKTIFDPLGMHRSSYASVAELVNLSPSFDSTGKLTQSFQYASAAATGLASSSSDLAKLAKALLSPHAGAGFRATTLEAMREPQGFVLGAGIWGLGTILYAPTSAGDYIFGHDGANDPAINSTVRLNPDTADGIIALVSGHPSLASNIGSEWVLWQTGQPDFLQTDRALKSAILPFLVGCLALFVAIFLWARALPRARVGKS